MDGIVRIIEIIMLELTEDDLLRMFRRCAAYDDFVMTVFIKLFAEVRKVGYFFVLLMIFRIYPGAESVLPYFRDAAERTGMREQGVVCLRKRFPEEIERLYHFCAAMEHGDEFEFLIRDDVQDAVALPFPRNVQRIQNAFDVARFLGS